MTPREILRKKFDEWNHNSPTAIWPREMDEIFNLFYSEIEKGDNELRWLIKRIRNQIDLLDDISRIQYVKSNLTEIGNRLEKLTYKIQPLNTPIDENKKYKSLKSKEKLNT